MRKLPFPRYTRLNAPLSRTERFVARLAIQVSHVLADRLTATRRAKRREPLVAILRELGYSMTARNPYGQEKQRANLIAALDLLRRTGQWDIDFLDLRGSEVDNDNPRGDHCDDTWIVYSRPAISQDTRRAKGQEAPR